MDESDLMRDLSALINLYASYGWLGRWSDENGEMTVVSTWQGDRTLLLTWEEDGAQAVVEVKYL